MIFNHFHTNGKPICCNYVFFAGPKNVLRQFYCMREKKIHQQRLIYRIFIHYRLLNNFVALIHRFNPTEIENITMITIDSVYHIYATITASQRFFFKPYSIEPTLLNLLACESKKKTNHKKAARSSINSFYVLLFIKLLIAIIQMNCTSKRMDLEQMNSRSGFFMSNHKAKQKRNNLHI